MKKFTLLAIVSLIGVASLYAQEKSTAIKLNYLSPVVKTFNVSFERAIKEDASIQLGVYYTGFTSGGISYSGLGITPEYRYYMSGEAIDGAYIAPFMRYQNVTLSESATNSKGTLSSFGGGLVIGRQWAMKAITFDIFVGPMYNAGSYSSSSGTSLSAAGSFDGFTVRFGTTIGLAF